MTAHQRHANGMAMHSNARRKPLDTIWQCGSVRSMDRTEKLPRKKKCKECGTRFQPVRTFEAWCSPDCGLAIARKRQAAASARQQAKQRQQITRQRKQARADKKAFNENDKKWLMKQAVFHCHAFIRLRDDRDPCISCNRFTVVQWHAGHYRPAGVNSALKFHPWNIHKQCSQCNNYQSANKHGDGGGAGYIANLTLKIGADAVQWLDDNHEEKKWTVDELREIIASYKQQKKELLKKRENEFTAL